MSSTSPVKRCGLHARNRFLRPADAVPGDADGDTFDSRLLYLYLMAYDPLTGLTKTFPVSGVSGFPTATFSPAAVDFGSQQLGVQSTAHQITVRNAGQSDLRITNVELLSDMAADFSTDISNCTLGNIPVGGTCKILAYFTPHTTGTRTGTLQLIDNEQTPATLLLTGESPL